MAIQNGSKRLALLRVKYSDKPLEPHDDAFYTDLFINRGTGGLNDYYLQQSHANGSFDGSVLFPWRTVNFTKAQYWARYPSRNARILGDYLRLRSWAESLLWCTELGNPRLTDSLDRLRLFVAMTLAEEENKCQTRWQLERVLFCRLLLQEL
ncbi:hypothetical protein VTL71DRAFT_5718 [Oculimacula yallundae]|uniref:Uncharacterized protein n=1 Tax=Oculimacula yallundae TaxID=86028 RepID=A0ABR4BZH6_9HELO